MGRSSDVTPKTKTSYWSQKDPEAKALIFLPFTGIWWRLRRLYLNEIFLSWTLNNIYKDNYKQTQRLDQHMMKEISRFDNTMETW